jgi:hypothetical protein
MARRVRMSGKRLLWVLVFLILLVSGVYATERIGVSIPASNSTYTQNDPINNATDNSGGPTYGIYVLGNSTDPALSLTVNATVNSTAMNLTGGSYAYGVYSYNATNSSNSRPLSNLVVTENGNINVNATSGGSGARAYGVYANNIEDFRVDTGGKIIVTANGITANASGIYQDGGNIENFTNEGSISITAKVNETIYGSVSGVYAYASGVEAEQIGNFTGNGTIFVSAIATHGSASAYGVKANNIDNFRLDTGGKITVTANASNYAINESEGDVSIFIDNKLIVGGVDAVNATSVVNNGTLSVNGIGGYVDYANNNVPAGFDIASLGNFTNTGNINVSIESENATAVGLRSYNISYFNNTGKISVFTNSTSGNFSTVIGVMAGKPDEFDGLKSGHIGTFINSGNLKITGYASGAELRAYGVAVFNGTIEEFQNLSGGRIEIYGNNTGGNTTVYGVGAFRGDGGYGNLTKFMNTGLINATAIGSNATSYGVYADDHIGNFTNAGTINITATATNGTAKAYGLKGGLKKGDAIYVIGNFTNKGTIKVSATGKNANATGIYVENATTGSTILNNGLIDVFAIATSGSVRSIGIHLKDSNATFTNNGTIKVYASGNNVDKVAGIYLTNSNVTLSNFGEIAVYGNNLSGAKLRTLYVDTNSNVTLKDKFAITFGAPGTGPEIAPIYVASGSMLNLNNTVLVVRIWNNEASSIVPNTPYALIEYNGTVSGNWGGLERGYANPLIDVSWYNASTDKDAMVIFKYNALNNPEQAMAPVSSIVAGSFINSFISGLLLEYLPIASPIYLAKGDEPVMLAASAVSDMPLGYGMGGATYRGGMWFIPVYTKVKASDLGFDADAYGFNLGLGGFLTRDLSLGLYVTYSRTDIDYRITAAKSGDVDLFAVGMTGRWTFMKDAYLRFNVNGFKTNNDYEGRTGLNLEMKEKASYDVKGMEGEVMIGKVYRVRIALIPEVGLKYNYHNPDSFWTKAYNSTGRVPAWDRYYDPDSQHVWKVVAGVNVVGDTKWGGNPVRLYLMGRVEQALGKNEVEVINYMRSDPTRYKLTKSLSKTTLVGQVGADVSLTKNFGVELSGRGDFNGDYSAYTGKAVIWYKW